ncbi:MAG: periplasmic heavy metal sensor [Syntrophaceae bacterium]
MKKTLFALLVTLLALAVAGSVFAQGRGPMGGRGMGPRCDVTLTPGLNLSADQAQKIRNMQSTHWKEVQPLRDQMILKRQELRSLWLQKTPDQAKIESVQKEAQDLRGKLQAKQTEYRLAVLKELTPEQQDRLKAANWGCPRMKAGHGGGGPRGGMMGGPRGQGMGPGMGMGPGAGVQAQ